MSEYDYEPVRGLPGQLPEGEKILWQGAPDWRSLAVHLCHIRSITIYFFALMVWRVVVTVSDGRPATDALEVFPWLAALLGIVVILIVAFSYLVGRTTIYTITTRRLVLRYGIAFTKAVNVPLRVVHSAFLRMHANGTGDIALALSGKDKIAYLILWPHARPWRFNSPEPMLRAVPEPQRVSEILRGALAGLAKDDVNDTGDLSFPARETTEKPFGQQAAAAA